MPLVVSMCSGSINTVWIVSRAKRAKSPRGTGIATKRVKQHGIKLFYYDFYSLLKVD